MSVRSLETVELTKSFGGVTAVDRATVTFQNGKVNALIGPNGSGKTTFFNCVTGMIKPDSGTATYRGKDITSKPSHVIARAGIGRSFQLCRIFPRMTVLENMLVADPAQPGEGLFGCFVRHGAMVRREAEARTKALELLALLNIERLADEYAGTMSGGQRKLVELGRVLMTDPTMIMLDEPMAGVNPALTQSLLDHVLNLKAQGMTVLFVEHDMHMVRHIADWVVVMAEGRVVAEGDPHEVMKNPAVIDAYLGQHHDEDIGEDAGQEAENVDAIKELLE